MVLHWIIAVLMVAAVVLGLTAESWPEDSIRFAVDTHKSIGITVMGLAILRILWRLGHPPPPLPPGYPKWERYAAHTAHFLLYALMLLLPLSGWMHDSAWKGAPTHPMTLFGLMPWPRIGFIESVEPVRKEWLHDLLFSFHEAFGYALYVLFALHVLGALKHQFIDREPEIQRMSL